MKFKTNELDKNITIDELLTNWLIWIRDHDLKFKIDDPYDRGYVLDDAEISKKELIDKFKKQYEE